MKIALRIHRALVGREPRDWKRATIIKNIVKQIIGEIPKPAESTTVGSKSKDHFWTEMT